MKDLESFMILVKKMMIVKMVWLVFKSLLLGQSALKNQRLMERPVLLTFNAAQKAFQPACSGAAKSCRHMEVSVSFRTTASIGICQAVLCARIVSVLKWCHLP